MSCMKKKKKTASDFSLSQHSSKQKEMKIKIIDRQTWNERNYHQW